MKFYARINSIFNPQTGRFEEPGNYFYNPETKMIEELFEYKISHPVSSNHKKPPLLDEYRNRN